MVANEKSETWIILKVIHWTQKGETTLSQITEFRGEDPNAIGGEEEGRQRQWVTRNKKRALFKADDPIVH